MAHRILVVDDDPAVRDLTTHVLKKAGFTVESVDTAEKGLAELRRSQYDLLILDLHLPGISGMKTCEIIKQDPATAHLPIIMLTAQDSERFKVQGLQTGADDYVTKTTSPAEFIARVNALLRRIHYAGVPGKVLQINHLKIDLERHEVFVKNKPISLRPKEFQLLALFVEKRGRVLTRSYLFESVWGQGVVTEHTLEVHINHLREKLGPLSQCIQTIPGVGYKFQEPA
jgi:DNA-binding response OmpR family regulator